ncbi:MAG: hypothetical protein AAGB19_05405 [Cyanobacteria bacterium P01_F01_bin.3]
MRFWLAAFVVLFAAVELFEWVTQLGSLQPTGIWLVLGGMGLAALSNASHWLRMTDASASDESVKCMEQSTVADAGDAIAQVSAANSQKAGSLADQSAQDSISFKVRPLKR